MSAQETRSQVQRRAADWIASDKDNNHKGADMGGNSGEQTSGMADSHPRWCGGGDGPHHEHYSPAIKVAGQVPLLVELAMDPEEDELPHVTILPDSGGRAFSFEVGQAMELSRALERVAATAGTSGR